MPTALTPSPNIGSQIERAVNAYLWECYGGTIPSTQFYAVNDWKVRDTGSHGLIETMAFSSTENPNRTRNEHYQCRIEAKWPGANQPGQSNKDWNLKKINDLIGVVMAALSITDDGGDSYEAACMKISAAGRRLAVLGTPEVTGATADDIANNADMARFICDYLQFTGSSRVMEDKTDFYFQEIRNFTIGAYNGTDASVFPTASMSGDDFNWAFTVGGISRAEPTGWLVQKSVDAVNWLTHETLASGARTSDITGLGGQYFRVFRTDGSDLLDPESNLVRAS